MEGEKGRGKRILAERWKANETYNDGIGDLLVEGNGMRKEKRLGLKRRIKVRYNIFLKRRTSKEQMG